MASDLAKIRMLVDTHIPALDNSEKMRELCALFDPYIISPRAEIPDDVFSAACAILACLNLTEDGEKMADMYE